ncbi:FliM/FliN family flagellar motor switch protein [Citrobacter sp. Igbk 16]|uniref:FliM/FliN family flagellar motor switch protein n=1 Tax=Citrobacter sp. Igbk 16 TaxID=2963958 RepID=UPI00230295B6|nr:FliM/FliN family flagellar motor switch protein [Citrobacter sp. Igbk 16]MDA8516261.1 FliM/FliN family flagellar motor switch protein [Citrobacter sp. Igbk 16]
MNTLFSCLRHLDATENLIMQYCARNATALLTNHTRVQGAFIHCSGVYAGTEVCFFVSAETLLQKYGLEDARFSVQQMGNKFISSLYSELLSNLSLGTEWFSEPIAEVVIEDPECQIPLHEKFYSSGDDAGFVWFPKTSLTSLDVPITETVNDCQHLLCPIKVSLGITSLPVSDIENLAIGDALWITNVQIYLYVGNIEYCALQYENHNFTVSEDIMDSQTNNDLVDKLWTTDGLKLNIEFVLSETTMTLAEISKIQNGDVLDTQIGLGDNKVDVELRVQGRTLAKGELVLLDDRLAVEIEEVYNTL